MWPPSVSRRLSLGPQRGGMLARTYLHRKAAGGHPSPPRGRRRTFSALGAWGLGAPEAAHMPQPAWPHDSVDSVLTVLAQRSLHLGDSGRGARRSVVSCWALEIALGLE